MAVTVPTYVTRQMLAAAMDVAPSAATNRELDRAIVEGSRAADTLCRRTFYPQTATRVFDWPRPGGSSPAYRLWLDSAELISLMSLTVAGEAVATSDVFLEPANDGPPYTHIDIDLSSAAAWEAGDTWQQSISVVGLFGYRNDVELVGALAEALDASETDIDVTAAAAAEFGIGDVMIVDAERMIVQSFGWVTTGETASLTASAADQSITVASIATYADGELLLIGGERIRVQDRAGTTLTVQRGVDGTTLAAHTTATLFAARTLRVLRGATGSTAATHDTAAAVYRQSYPAEVVELAQAEAEVSWQQKRGAYARPQGSGARAVAAASGTLEDVRARCRAAHGRIRQEAV